MIDRLIRVNRVDLPLTLIISVLVIFSIFVLNSFSPDLFPQYYLYIVFGILLYLLFTRIDFEVLVLFSKHLYFFSILALIATLVVGGITRGAVRWIPIGSFTIQPAEITKPFIILFLSSYLARSEMSVKHMFFTFLFFLIPFMLIFIQPSLSLSVLLMVAFVGVVVSAGVSRKLLLILLVLILITLPLLWQFVLAPYQKERISTFVNPYKNPLGAGYNSIQSIVAVGSGGVWGRGLGKGVQTQLKFLPEKHTDFVFASISEELGFLGAGLVLMFVFFLLYRITYFIAKSRNPIARAYITGIFLSLFIQIVINIGMNLGILPVSGVPLPLVSAGGSSLMGTLISLGLSVGAMDPKK